MQLNCKKGDIAIVIKSSAGNEGKVVRCLELVVTGRVKSADGSRWLTYAQGVQPLWRTDTPMQWAVSKGPNVGKTYYVNYATDAQLRPLRGDLSQDAVTTDKELCV